MRICILYTTHIHARIKRGEQGSAPILETHAITGCHHRPTSETPLKWRFAGGSIIARLEYWYAPPLTSPLC